MFFHVQFLYLPTLVILFKCSLCILICECIWLFFVFIGCMFILWYFVLQVFLYFSILVMFMSVWCSVMFSFFVCSNVHDCFVFCHDQYFVFFNFGNVLQVYLNLWMYLFVFLSSSFVCLFFDTLYFSFFCIFQFY